MEDSPATHRVEEAVLERGLRRDGSGANDHHSRGGPVPRLGAVRESTTAFPRGIHTSTHRRLIPGCLREGARSYAKRVPTQRCGPRSVTE